MIQELEQEQKINLSESINIDCEDDPTVYSDYISLKIVSQNYFNIKTGEKD